MRTRLSEFVLYMIKKIVQFEMNLMKQHRETLNTPAKWMRWFLNWMEWETEMHEEYWGE